MRSANVQARGSPPSVLLNLSTLWGAVINMACGFVAPLSLARGCVYTSCFSCFHSGSAASRSVNPPVVINYNSSEDRHGLCSVAEFSIEAMRLPWRRRQAHMAARIPRGRKQARATDERHDRYSCLREIDRFDWRALIQTAQRRGVNPGADNPSRPRERVSTTVGGPFGNPR